MLAAEVSHGGVAPRVCVGAVFPRGRRVIDVLAVGVAVSVGVGVGVALPDGVGVGELEPVGVGVGVGLGEADEPPNVCVASAASGAVSEEPCMSVAVIR